MSQIKIQVLDRQAQRSEREVTTGTTAGDLYDGDRDVVVARVNGQLRDLAWVLADGDEVEPVTADSPEGRAVIRHSTAHVMAQAVQQAFPEAKLGIGPPVENGFYYDFQVDRAFTPDDLKSIESRMRDIVKQGQRFVRREVTDAEARAELADEPFKLELIGIKGSTGGPTTRRPTEVGAGVLTIYDNVDAKTGELRWKDLCRGPHVPSTRQHPGVQADAQRRRVLARQREEPAAAADLRHRVGVARRAGRLPEDARGGRAARPPQARRGARPVLLPRGDRLGPAGLPPQGRHHPPGDGELLAPRHEEAGYSFVNTPHITKGHLFETSGHLPYYADTMFPPMELEGSEYYLKAMNCPMHNLIFRARGRSYRELPLRLFEFGTVYRYEKSGVVHGLTRVRGLTMDDSHIYCTREQMEDELQVGAHLHPRPAARLRPRRLLPGAVHPRRLGQVHRLRRGVGVGDRARCATSPRSPASSWCPTRAAPRSTGRRSPSRPATRSAGPGRCRPSSSTSTSPSGSAWSTRPPTAPGRSRS